MIELNFKGMCKDCKCADLEVHSIYAETIGGSEYKTWCVRCIHEDACHRIKDVTMKIWGMNNKCIKK